MNEIDTKSAHSLNKDRVGSLVWWNIADTLAADPALLELSFKQHAPDLVKRLPKVMEPASAARDAMQCIRASRPEGTEWVVLGETDEELKLSFNKEVRDVGAETFEAKEVMVLRVNKKNGDVTTSPARDQLVNGEAVQLDAFLAKYKKSRALLMHKALTRFITGIILGDQKARRAKTHGGVFFVRTGLDERVFDLMTAMQPAGMDIVVVETGRERAGQFAGGIEQSFLEQISKLKGDVEKRLTDLTEKNKISREETFKTRLTQLEDMKKETKVFEQLIGMASDDIQEAIVGAAKLTESVMEDMKKALVAEQAKSDAKS